MGRVSILFLFTFYCSIAFGGNHSPLHPHHVQTAEKFIQRHLLNDSGEYELEKVRSFVQRLEKEAIWISEDYYETKIIEKVELELKSIKKAIKSAEKELEEETGDMLFAYNQGLIPLMKSIEQLVAEGAARKEIDAKVDDFLVMYAAFYLPEAPRNIFHQDRSPFTFIKQVFGYKFDKNTDGALEANNLIVGDYQEEIKNCLGQEKQRSDYLTQSELESLKGCGFDISLLEPGKSPLMKKVTVDEVKARRAKELTWFPTENEKLVFVKMKYSSSGSPKFKAEFKRNGKKIDVKVKLAHEVNVEPITATIANMLGMTSDTMTTRPTVKVYLDEGENFDSFSKEWRRKYRGLRQELATHVHSHSHESEDEQWIVFKDVQLEIKDPNKVRLEGYHPWGWDLPNRREQRAQVLWYAFMSLLDTKAGNHKVNLYQGPNGIETEYLLQDLGYSLHFAINTHYKELLETGMSVNRWGVNSFNKDFMTYDDDKVHFWWAEAMIDKTRFEETTYNDLKWMARRIANLSEDDIAYAVNQSGFHPAVKDLYIKKLCYRRNTLIKAFDLEQESTLVDLPDLDTYSPNDLIKNGKIAVTNLEGSTNYEQIRVPIWSLGVKMFTSLFPIEWIKENISAKITDTINLEARKDKSLTDPKTRGSLEFGEIKSGIGFNFSRDVTVNNQWVNYGENDSQAWVVKDKISINFGVSSGIVKKISDTFDLNITGEFSVYKREFEFIHFANTWLDGYKSEFKILKLLANFKEKATEMISAGEVLKVSDGYGWNLKAGVPLPVGSTGLEVEIGKSIGWNKSSGVYFGRNSFSQFYVYQDKSASVSVGTFMEIGAIDLFLKTLPLLELKFSYDQFDYESKLYKFEIPQYTLDRSVLTRLQVAKDQKALNELLNEGEESPSVLGRREFQLQAAGEVQNIESTFLFFVHDRYTEENVEIDVEHKEGEQRKFFRSTRKDEGYLGDRNILFIEDITVKSRQGTKVSVETDAHDLGSMTALIEYTDYDRKKSKSDLENHIAKLNQSFSKNPDNPEKQFFRNYVLPSVEEVKEYRKIWSYIRIYVDVEKLIEKIVEMDQKEYYSLMLGLNHVTNSTRNRYRRSERLGDRFTYGKHRGFDKFMKFKTALEQENLSIKETTQHVADFLRLFDFKTNGLQKFTEHFGKKHVFVMGEIFGIFPSFSTLQTDEAVAGRRFAGKSWGKFKSIPPIRKYIKNNDLGPMSIFVRDDGKLTSIFGELPWVKSAPHY